MTKRRRALVAIVLVELVLAGIWFYLAILGASDPDRMTADFQETLGSTIGTAMGAFLGLGFMLYLMAAKQDRNQG